MDNEYQVRAIQLIEAQQAKTEEFSEAWAVGEQLKDICQSEPECARILAEDLQNEAMGIEEAEEMLCDWAGKHRKGSFACITPKKADEILRSFYGLPKKGEAAPEPKKPIFTGPSAEVDLEDFF